jgi:hypothetical protein
MVFLFIIVEGLRPLESTSTTSAVVTSPDRNLPPRWLFTIWSPNSIDESASALNWPNPDQTEQTPLLWFVVIPLLQGQWRGNCYWQTQAYPNTNGPRSLPCQRLTHGWVTCSQAEPLHGCSRINPVDLNLQSKAEEIPCVLAVCSEKHQHSRAGIHSVHPCQWIDGSGGRPARPAPRQSTPHSGALCCERHHRNALGCFFFFFFLPLLPVALWLNPTWPYAESCQCTPRQLPSASTKRGKLLIQQAGLAAPPGSLRDCFPAGILWVIFIQKTSMPTRHLCEPNLSQAYSSLTGICCWICNPCD